MPKAEPAEEYTVPSATTFARIVEETRKCVDEIFPWDLSEKLEAGDDLLLLDVREPAEFEAMHIEGSLNVPRGILESACEYGYEETVPELVRARDRDVVVVCRSGNRSVLAAAVMQQLGYGRVSSLKTGLRGWNDYDQPLVDIHGNPVDPDTAEAFFTPRLTPEQMGEAD